MSNKYEAVARALTAGDFTDVSIGDKACIRAAIDRLHEAASSSDAMRDKWFAALTGATSALESAASCMTDTDAKKVANSAAEFYRKQAHELWQAAEAAPGSI